MSTLTHEQIQKLSRLGISIPPQSISDNNKVLHQNSPNTGQIPFTPQPGTHQTNLLPLLSISGFTVISFAGLLLFKTKSDIPATQIQTTSPQTSPAPVTTQVPKSIQHYLLASQQYFTQALSLQSSKTTDQQNSELVQLLNQSLLAATEAIKNFPSDFRGYHQRSRIYQSLADSQPQLLPQAIGDLAAAVRYNPNSPELTRELASLYAKTGNADMTLNYLSQTIILEPTKAQNFYDLAQIQQQAGLLPDALQTYTRLLPLVSDLSQRQQLQTEIQTLQKLVIQNIHPSEASAKEGPSPTITLPENPPTLKALTDSNIIIAAPEIRENIQIENQTNSNSLSGTATLPANQKQLTLTNSHLSSASKLYLTITEGGKNQNLQVLSKSQGFAVIGLDTPISEDIDFKWWIIN